MRKPTTGRELAPRGAGLTRRRFLQALAATGLGAVTPGPGVAVRGGVPLRSSTRLLLAGDVMTGRGVDQILPHSVAPTLYEPYVKDARDYVKLAEAENGPIPAPVDYDYIWGDVPGLLAGLGVGPRIINLETAVTDHDEPWPDKGINYRMHTANAPVLNALGTDVCVLANNHVLDWQAAGLTETLDTLHEAGLRTAGAGNDAEEARRPAAMPLRDGRRLLVFAFGLPSSGVPAEWAAGDNRPGLHFLPDLSNRRLSNVAALIREHSDPGDLIVVSVHWGGNWGYEIGKDQRHFARGLIDEAGVDVVHGHSSHHPQGLEVHCGRLVLYGCGDFINDYEGIGGHEHFRPDLVAMYLPLLASEDGALEELSIVPLRIERMRLRRTDMKDARWMAERLNAHVPVPGQRLEALERTLGGSPTPCLRLQ